MGAMTDLERVARALRDESNLWRLRSDGAGGWGVFRGAHLVEAHTPLWVAEDRLGVLHDAACARAALTELRTPGPAIIAAIGRHVRGNLSDADCVALMGVIVDAILGEPQP
jgi:hypothetical protein